MSPQAITGYGLAYLWTLMEKPGFAYLDRGTAWSVVDFPSTTSLSPTATVASCSLKLDMRRYSVQLTSWM